MTTDKTIKSKYQPKQTNVTWIDLGGETPVEKHFVNGRWIAVSGDSSSGTTNYSKLTNKPSINGVELNGNKTSSNLGVATSQQGAKADTAYQKPSNGIPESDLSSDVQQALQKHFKGWYASSSALPANPVIGDYAYVKGAESTDPAAIYECTTAGSWSDSGRTADTSNVQTFASNQEVNEVHIINNLTTGGADNVLSAEQGKELAYRHYQFTNAGSIGNNGNPNTTPGWSRSDYIEIQGGEKVYGYGNSTRCVVAFYDDNKTFISGIFPSSANLVYVDFDNTAIPVNAVYFIAVTLNTYMNDSYIIQPYNSKITKLVGANQINQAVYKANKIDCVLSQADVILTAPLALNINLEYDSAYIMIKCSTPPISQFNIGRRTNYTSTINNYLTNCGFNTWIRVDKDDTKGNILCVYRAGISFEDTNAVVVFKSLEESIEERLESLENNPVDARVEQLESDVYGEKEYQVQDGIKENKIYSFRIVGGTVNGPTTLSNCYCLSAECKEGDSFRIYGKSYNLIYLYCFANASNKVLQIAEQDINTRTDGIVVTAPANTAYIFVNLYQYSSTTDKVERLVTTQKGIVDEIEDIKEFSNGALVGKNIVVFGDSLSEFKYTGEGSDGKGWVDHAKEICGANFINIAIGGTQIKQRYSKLPTLFDSTKTYNIGDWVFYKPSSKMNCYECTAQHTGAWSDSDFSEVTYNVYLYAQLDIVSIVTALCNNMLADTMACAQCIADHNYGDNNVAQIQRLIDVDWSIIDAVIIMAGGNDFGASAFGETDSLDKMKESGAINEIVRLMSSTYKNVPIYYSTDTVRWFNYSSGSGVDANWCDVYVPSGGTLNYRDFFTAVVNQFKLHHIPTIDLYNTLGWNKWNFSNFFTDNDGTHPYKGFRQIAEKIVSFIISNKVFK